MEVAAPQAARRPLQRDRVNRQRVANPLPCQEALPSAPQGTIQIDEAAGDVATHRGQLILLLHQQRLRVEDAIEIRGPPFELVDDQFDGSLGFDHALFRPEGLFLVLQVSNQRVFYFASAAQNGLLVLQYGLLQTRILHADVVGDAPVVQHVPLKAGELRP